MFLQENSTQSSMVFIQPYIFIGFADASEMWLQPYIAPNYTTTNFTEDIDELWNGLSGFYQKLHGYVRYRLRNSEAYWNIMAEDSPIPAHLLGNSDDIHPLISLVKLMTHIPAHLLGKADHTHPCSYPW